MQPYFNVIHAQCMVTQTVDILFTMAVGYRYHFCYFVSAWSRYIERNTSIIVLFKFRQVSQINSYNHK